MVARALKRAGKAALLLAIGTLLAAVIVPRYLDRIYYRGPATDHFDGARFFNPDGDADVGRAPGGGSRAGFMWRQLTGSDHRPPWPDSVAVRASKPAARVEGDRMVATWVGHATMLVQTAGLNILTDPIYADTAGPFGFGPRRVARPGIAFDDLPPIDLVVVSHNHYDHMDLATLKRLWDRDRPVIVTSLGNDALIRGAGIPGRGDVTDCGHCPGVEALDWGENAYLVRGGEGRRQDRLARVSVVRNHHWGSRWFADRNRALWSAFLIDTAAGSIFFAGDTGLGDGRWPAEARAQAAGPIRLALIPIGAFRFAPGQMASGNHIGPVQAAEVHRRLGAATSVPIHWGTFRLSYEGYDTPPRLLSAAMACAAAPGTGRFDAVPIGQPIEVAPVGAAQPPRPARPAPPPMAVRACIDTPAVRAMR